MTKDPARGNGEGLSALLSHISRMQSKAICLERLIDACSALEYDQAYSDDRSDLAELACKVANDLNKGLDLTALPEVRS